MKIKISKQLELTPFADLKVGEPLITATANLEMVNTIYVKLPENRYTQLGQDGHVWTADTEPKMVRRVKILEATVELI